jgi:hypothetical protein
MHAGGTEDPARVADRLRTRVLELESQVQSQQHQLTELRAQLSLAAQSATTQASLSPEELAAIPTPIALSIDARSGLSRDGTALDVLLLPVDGRGRFVQVAGTLTIALYAVASSSPEANSPESESGTSDESNPSTLEPLWSRELSPSQLRDAYRSGFLGTYYLVAVPLSDALRDAYASKGLDARVMIDIAASETKLTTARTFAPR